VGLDNRHASALLASIAGFGRVVAPVCITAADVTLEGLPSHVRPGQTLQLRLALGARHADQSTEELEVSLGALAAATRCAATRSAGTDILAQISALLTPSPTMRCLASVLCPATVRPAVLMSLWKHSFWVNLSVWQSSFLLLLDLLSRWY